VEGNEKHFEQRKGLNKRGTSWNIRQIRQNAKKEPLGLKGAQNRREKNNTPSPTRNTTTSPQRGGHENSSPAEVQNIVVSWSARGGRGGELSSE